MKRETRYLVIKYTDLDNIDNYYFNNLSDILDEVNKRRQLRGKEELACVVIESDWPEYETVWKLLEERVDHQNTIP